MLSDLLTDETLCESTPYFENPLFWFCSLSNQRGKQFRTFFLDGDLGVIACISESMKVLKQMHRLQNPSRISQILLMFVCMRRTTSSFFVNYVFGIDTHKKRRHNKLIFVSVPHKSRAPGSATQDHAQARGLDAAS